jgi:ligand-binding sensor domain-containing protein
VRTGIVLVVLSVALLASGLGAARAAVPETPRFRIIGAAQGLPSTDFFGIARDRDGYVWVATGDGLARYDGLEMRVWRHDPDDPASLPGNNVQFVHVDARDQVWVATENGGLSVLDRGRRGFRHVRKADHPRMGNDDVFAIASRGDELWFGNYEGGLHRMAADGTITRFAHDDNDPHSLPSDTIMSLVFDRAGTLWIGTRTGLARFDGRKPRRVELPGNPSPLLFSVSLVGDTLWVGTAQGIHLRKPDGRWSQPAWSSMFERPNALLKVARDDGGAYWLGSQRGLWRVLPGQVPAPVPLGGPGIVRPIPAMLRHDDGALWVPVAGAGLGYLRSDWRRIAQFSRNPDGLQGDMYRALAPARDGGVWLGGYNGAVEHLDSSSGAIRRPSDEVLARLKGTRAFSIAEDHDGRLWLGSTDSLTRIGSDGAVDDWSTEDPRDPIPRGWIDQLRIAPDGSLWLSSQGGGIQQRDPASGRVLVDIGTGDAGGLGVGDTDAMEFAPDGGLWIAGAHGLSRLAADGRRFTALDAMRGERVFGFAFDGRDALWLQRLAGLERYERRDGAWRRTAAVGTKDGLPSLGAAGVRVDRLHRVWVSTSRGLFRWSPLEKRLRHYGVQQGISSQEFLRRAITLGADGVLVAGTADGGVVLVDTAAAEPRKATPVLRFDSFAVRRDGRWRDEPLREAMAMSPSCVKPAGCSVEGG